MEMDIINPATLTDAGKKLIAQIKVAPASRLAFISGQVALTKRGSWSAPAIIVCRRFRCSPISSWRSKRRADGPTKLLR